MANHRIAKKGRHGTPMGVPSIIAILVILVLVVFSALALTTSNADLKLSEKTAVSVRDYYEADSSAEIMMATAVKAVRTGKTGGLPAGMALKKVDEGAQVVYNVPIDEGRELSVELLITEDGKVTRKLWQVITTAEWNPDMSLDVIR